MARLLVKHWLVAKDDFLVFWNKAWKKAVWPERMAEAWKMAVLLADAILVYENCEKGIGGSILAWKDGRDGLKDGLIARQTSVCAGSNWGFFLRLSMLAKHRFVLVATGDFFAVMLANTLFGMVATGDFLKQTQRALGLIARDLYKHCCSLE